MAKVLSTSTNVGGAGKSAKAGAYNQGLQFAAQRGGDKPGSHKDLRGSTGSGCYHQGAQIAAQKK